MNTSDTKVIFVNEEGTTLQESHMSFIPHKGELVAFYNHTGEKEKRTVISVCYHVCGNLPWGTEYSRFHQFQLGKVRITLSPALEM